MDFQAELNEIRERTARLREQNRTDAKRRAIEAVRPTLRGRVRAGAEQELLESLDVCGELRIDDDGVATVCGKPPAEGLKAFLAGEHGRAYLPPEPAKPKAPAPKPATPAEKMVQNFGKSAELALADVGISSIKPPMPTPPATPLTERFVARYGKPPEAF